MPEYTAVFDNAVYSRTLSSAGQNGGMPLQEILLPRRYREPTGDGVVHYLQEKTGKMLSVPVVALPDGRYVVAGAESELELAVARLPPSVKRDIIEGSPDCIEFIKRHTSARSLAEGETPLGYMETVLGILPERLIFQHQSEGKIDGRGWYEAALLNEKIREAGMGYMWRMRIRYDDYLPERNDVDVLLRNETHGSRTLDISLANYNVEAARRVVDFAYDRFPDRASIDLLTDISGDILDSASIDPVMALHQAIQAQIEEKR